jgi:hypothetical protein
VPTIVRSGAFEIRILTFDHPPAHVHGIKAGKKAKMNDSPPKALRAYG